MVYARPQKRESQSIESGGSDISRPHGVEVNPQSFERTFAEERKIFNKATIRAQDEYSYNKDSGGFCNAPQRVND